ncbi:MAG: geranylgeranylglycerol-phosphate geranylgeranyltransferase [Bacteroidota bacterium]|nr:geranylgeranylglycerol-phosphate geranylgeranyltransferase [Bacteroidota bacterium]
MNFLKLIRWPNLVIVILTQLCVKYFLINALLSDENISTEVSFFSMLILVLATVFVTASGYIINDIYDIDTDKVNKPTKQFVGKEISVKQSWRLYLVFSVVGFALGVVFGFMLGVPWLGVIFFVIELLLWGYSFWMKSIALIGNFAVAILSAFVIVIVWLPEFLLSENLGEMTFLVLIYSLFAFMVSLIREIIKDTEDIKGDAAIKCLTLPIVIGKPKTKIVVSVLILLSISIMVLFQFVMFQQKNYLLFVYLLLFVQLPFLWLLYKNYTALSQMDFHKAGSFAKLIMLTGILSMILV